MSSPSPYEEAQWRRPEEGTPPPPPTPPQVGGPATYSGPPPTTPPPPGWRPPVVVQTPPPRMMPPQNLPGLDEAEQRARTFTLGIAMVSGAVMVVLVLVLCGRALFF